MTIPECAPIYGRHINETDLNISRHGGGLVEVGCLEGCVDPKVLVISRSGQMERVSDEQQYLQMFCETATVLITLATLFALEIAATRPFRIVLR